MAETAREAGRSPAGLYGRIESLAGSLGEPEKPSLVHGEVWGGNVLTKGDRTTAFLDPRSTMPTRRWS